MIGFLSLLVGSAYAATFSLTGVADNPAAPAVGSLRYALLHAGSGDVIVPAYPSAGYVEAPTQTLPPLLAVLQGADEVVVDGTNSVVTGLIVGDGGELYGVEVKNFSGDGVQVQGENAVVGGAGPLKNYIWGNGGAGVRVFSSVSAGSTTIVGNQIGHKRSGLMGQNCLAPDGSCAGILYLSPATAVIEGNTVDGTWGQASQGQGSGIYLASGADVLVENNDIGLLSGNNAHGILVTGSAGNPILRPSILENHIGGNERTGIYLGRRITRPVVQFNVIGFNKWDAPLGNLRNGVLILGIDKVELTDNIIGNNGRHGVHITGSTGGNHTSDHHIWNNTIGLSPTGAAAGNSWSGISVATAGSNIDLLRNEIGHNDHHGVVVSSSGKLKVRYNEISHNGWKGISAGAGRNLGLTGNSIFSNGSCAANVEHATMGAPVLVHRGRSSVSFSVSSANPVHSVEVFYTTEDEADRSLGFAIETGSVWSFDLTKKAGDVFAAGQFTAVATDAIGLSAGPTDICGNGCSSGLPATCSDGNPCTADVCNVGSGTCSSSGDPSLVGATCSDGSSLTVGDTCLGDGACNPGAPTGPADQQCSENLPGLGLVRQECASTNIGCLVDNVCSDTSGCLPLPAPLPGTCHDFNDCTSDVCVDVNGVAECSHSSRDQGFLCEDGNQCTALGSCDGEDSCVLDLDQPECPFESDCVSASGQCSPSLGCDYEDGASTCGPMDSCTENAVKDPVKGWFDSQLWSTDCAAAFADIDHDGVPDFWEGTDIYDGNCDGNTESMTSLFGPSPDGDPWLTSGKSDMFVEIGYMSGKAPPTAGEVSQITTMFKKANNPAAPGALGAGWQPGIHLNLVVSPTPVPAAMVVSTGVSKRRAPTDSDCDSWNTLENYKRMEWAADADPLVADELKFGWWHYLVLGDRLAKNISSQIVVDGDGVCNTLGNTGGSNDQYGDGALITISGVPQSSNQLVGTIVHELGHNLGLEHNGRGAGGEDHKPHYLSNMSYYYQFSGFWTGGGALAPALPNPIYTNTFLASDQVPDYNREALSTLQESSLVESYGPGGPPPLGGTLISERRMVVLHCPPNAAGFSRRQVVDPRSAYVDFNCNSLVDGAAVPVDINGENSISSAPWGTDPVHDWARVEEVGLVVCDPGGYKHGAEIEEEEVELPVPLHLVGVRMQPGCEFTGLPLDHLGELSFLVYGSSEVDPSQLTDVLLSGASPLPGGTSDYDEDGDGFLDREYHFLVSDLGPTAPGIGMWLHFGGFLPNGDEVTRTIGDFNWAPTLNVFGCPQ